MTNKAHSTLTGSDLHEPKGVAAATAGQVYISNGSGSGTWTDTGATVGSSSFSTGDLKPTWKLTADSGWIMCDDGTIGDLSSGATTLASATTASLYAVLWNNFANTEAAVSTGRGASAAADFASHKTIALPKMLGRVYGVAGAGAGLTSRAMGKATGSEQITQANLPACTFTVTDPGHTHNVQANDFTNSGNATVRGAGGTSTVYNNVPTLSGTTGISVTSGGSGTSYVQPTVFLKMMVKL